MQKFLLQSNHGFMSGTNCVSDILTYIGMRFKNWLKGIINIIILAHNAKYMYA